MSTTEALRRYRAAKKALLENQRKEIAAGITHETPEYLRLNKAVLDAEEHVPAWLR